MREAPPPSGLFPIAFSHAGQAPYRRLHAAAITSTSTSQASESVWTTIAVVGTTRPPSAATQRGDARGAVGLGVGDVA